MTFLIEHTPDWFLEGACHGRIELAPLFYPDNEAPALYTEAREYCNHCPVKTQCRDYAIDHDILFGMWGGLTPRERERYRKNPEAFVLHLLLCEECAAPLRGKQRMFCSTVCVRKAARRRSRSGAVLPGNCRICGKAFVRRNPNQVLCSPECQKVSVAERQAVRRRCGAGTVCWQCGKPVTTGNARDRHCSDACRAESRRIRSRRYIEKKRAL